MSEAFAPAVCHELEEITRAMRGAIGSLRAAAETLERYPALADEPRSRLLAVVTEESARLAELVYRAEQLTRKANEGWSSASAAFGADEALARIAAAGAELGCEVEIRHDTEREGEVDLVVAGDELVTAAARFLKALRREMAVTLLQLRARRVDRHLLFDIGWQPEAADLDRLLDWQADALDDVPEGRGLRPLAREHDGEAWFNLDRDGGAAHVKVLLPLAAARETVAR